MKILICLQLHEVEEELNFYYYLDEFGFKGLVIVSLCELQKLRELNAF
jgi:hypothetical protein